MTAINSLRIMILTPSLPYPPNWGFGIRVYQFVKHLSCRHRVTLVTYAWPGQQEKIAAIEQLGVCVHTVPMPATFGGKGKRKAQAASLFSRVSFQSRSWYTPQMQALIDRLQAEEPYDIVQVESAQMDTYRFAPGTVVLLDEHNIEYELLYRMYRSEWQPLRRLYNGLEHLKFRSEERRSWQRAAGCMLTSAREEKILRRYAPGQLTTVAPNGVDIHYFSPQTDPIDPDSLVFTGLIGYRPNTDAVLYFAREILPHILRVRPRAVFTIVGMNVPEEVQRLVSPHIVVTGTVPDVRPFVARAGVFVVPLRMGSGTRLKVLEGLAMGKAMVSTTLGCEGISVRDGEHLLNADEPAAFAKAVLRLMQSASLSEQLGKAGRELVERDYSWASVVQGMEAFYTQILQARECDTLETGKLGNWEIGKCADQDTVRLREAVTTSARSQNSSLR